ncbi:hypothetical protein D3C77_651870 [compost metagenome]
MNLMLEQMGQQPQALFALNPVGAHDAHVTLQLIVAQQAAVGDQPMISLGLLGTEHIATGERLMGFEEALAIGLWRFTALLGLQGIQVKPINGKNVIERGFD